MSEETTTTMPSKKRYVGSASKPQRTRKRRVALPDGVTFADAAQVYALVSEHAKPIRDALAGMKPAVRAYAGDVLAQALAEE